MTFYQKGVGRPTTEERVVIDAIYRIAQQKGISVSELPMCHDIDELSELLRMVQTAEFDTSESFEQPISEELKPLDADLPIEDESLDVEPQETETLSEPIEQTFQDIAYTQAEEESTPLEKEDALHASTPKGSDPGFIAPDYDPFSDPVIERSYTDEKEDIEEEQDEELPNDKTPLDDAPPQAKRRAAEQTAKAILKGYAQVAPIPFKWLAKIPEDKVERMAFDGELDTTLEVSEGMTFDDYMRETNEQLDELFEVDEATLDDIREPLIDVLMEQQLELTPTQRLVMAVVSHLGQMLSIALKLRKQNNRILAYQQHITHMTRTRAA